MSYLAAPITLSLFIFWKVYTRDLSFGVELRTVDLNKGRRQTNGLPSSMGIEELVRKEPIWRRAVSLLF